jgi:sarcosine oxidase subunit beta
MSRKVKQASFPIKERSAGPGMLDASVATKRGVVRYSILSVLAQALAGQKGWQPVWREPEPKPAYDIVIVGGGGHGLATAYYLAKEHGLTNIAVVEKGYIGSGNVGRNTTIIRSNYLLPGNTPFYELSLKLWEGLEQDLDYNAMVSQRGIINICHSDAQRDAFARRGNAMRLAGVDSELLDRDALKAMVPYLDFDNGRFPVHGGLMQRRGGTVRHDAVAWGYARGADGRGVDVIQNCEVTGIKVEGGRAIGLETSRGFIGAKKIGLACAGNSSRVAALAGLRLPIESHVLQAFVSEGIKPLIDHVITFGAGHFYISQSDKGGLVFGGDIDGYNSYAQRGNLPTVEDVCEGGMALMPMIGRVRLLRSWGGIMDMSMDGSPIIDRTPVEGLYLNAGWCYGGFKATPASGWCFAHLMARDEPHPVSAAYRLDRFATGHLIDERGAGAQPNLH